MSAPKLPQPFPRLCVALLPTSCTSYTLSDFLAGPLITAPVVMSNREPWHGDTPRHAPPTGPSRPAVVDGQPVPPRGRPRATRARCQRGRPAGLIHKQRLGSLSVMNSWGGPAVERKRLFHED